LSPRSVILSSLARHGPGGVSGSPDGRQRTAVIERAREEARELSVIDQRKFRLMVDEVPNFALYIMAAMARRIRGMGQAM
jgi:CRP-like cAMP-binding protein